MNKQLLQKINSLTSTIDSLNATINAQAQLITQFNQTIQELREQLNKNSKNSSNPPSSDGYKKTVPKSLRKPSGKRVGGQVGHQGTHLAVITATDEIVKHMPSAEKGAVHYTQSNLKDYTQAICEYWHYSDTYLSPDNTKENGTGYTFM